MATQYANGKIVTDGLVLCLNAADKNSYPGSGTTWYDVSGNGNNGTLVNGPSYGTSYNGTITTDGVNDYIITNAVVEACSNSNLQTLSVWGIGNGDFFGSYANGTGQHHLKVYLSGTTLCHRVSYYGGAAGESDITATVTPNAANNIVLVKTAPYYYDVYFNGVKAISNSYKVATVSTNFYPGVYYGNLSSGAWSYAVTSNYLIYNRALSASEILQNYNAQKSRFNL